MVESLPKYPLQLYELFRGAGKTEIVTQAYVIWHVLRPDRLVVIVGSKETQAKQNLRNITSIIRRWWVLNDLGLRTETKSEIELENGSQVLIRSMLSDLRGMKNEIIRPSLVILDDPIPDNLRLPLQDYVDYVFDSIMPAVDQDGQLIICGTPVHYDDVVMTFRTVEPCFYLRVPLTTCTGRSNWPAKYPPEVVEEMRERYAGRPLLWAKNYDLVLTDLTKGQFKKEWVEDFVEPEWAPDREWIRVMGVDPAIRRNEIVKTRGKPDYFAVAIVDYFYRVGKWKVVATYHEHLNFIEQVNKIKELYALYQPQYVVIESNFYQSALAETLIEESSLPVVGFTQTKNKVERILELGPYLANGKMKFTERAFNDDFEIEYVNFPDPKDQVKDDMLDALHLAFFYSLHHAGDRYMPPIFSI